MKPSSTECQPQNGCSCNAEVQKFVIWKMFLVLQSNSCNTVVNMSAQITLKMALNTITYWNKTCEIWSETAPQPWLSVLVLVGLTKHWSISVHLWFWPLVYNQKYLKSFLGENSPQGNAAGMRGLLLHTYGPSSYIKSVVSNQYCVPVLVEKLPANAYALARHVQPYCLPW